jgi:hypothetical protein
MEEQILKWTDELTEEERQSPSWTSALGFPIQSRGDRPIRTAGEFTRDNQARGGVLFLGDAGSGGVASVCDATERLYYRKGIECIGIVVACPLFEKGMIRMRGISQHLDAPDQGRDRRPGQRDQRRL